MNMNKSFLILTAPVYAAPLETILIEAPVFKASLADTHPMSSLYERLPLSATTLDFLPALALTSRAEQ
eukprot:5113973-Amphidinium_carterae.1